MSTGLHRWFRTVSSLSTGPHVMVLDRSFNVGHSSYATLILAVGSMSAGFILIARHHFHAENSQSACVAGTGSLYTYANFTVARPGYGE